MVDVGLFGGLIDPAFATLSPAERDYILTTVYRQVAPVCEAARTMVEIREEHRKLRNPPVLIEE